MSSHYAKPENALRKASDLIKVGKQDVALRILHSMLGSRRHRTWQETHEKIMLLYVKLAVDLRINGRDGMMQYRMICQQQHWGSLEKVIRHFLACAEEKAAEAGKLADEQAEKAEITSQYQGEVAELGYDPSLIRFFVPGVGGESDEDRSKRKLLTPWLKYQWEAYRTVLDVLRNNAKLDHLYHETISMALSYCRQHERTSEFRRLCDLLRQHMISILTHQQQTNAVMIGTSAAAHAYLATRFKQLEVATALDMWQEAYRLIEDIHELLDRTQSDLDESLLDSFYAHLGKIFWASKNPLFHAYCQHRVLSLCLATDGEGVKERADGAVLAALVISKQTSSDTSCDETMLYGDDLRNLKLATMLGFEQGISRDRLIARIIEEGHLARASQEVRELFEILSSKFAPLKLYSLVKPLIDWVAASSLKLYESSLNEVLVESVASQLSRVYKTIPMERFFSLIPPMSEQRIEQLVERAARARRVRVMLDHTERRLVFLPPAHRDIARNVAVTLAHDLQAIVDRIHPMPVEEKEMQRQQVFRFVANGMEQEHRDVFVRKRVIERRKKEHTRMVHRQREEERERELAVKFRFAEEERRRLQEERERRERERLERIEKERMNAMHMKMIEKLKQQQAEATATTTKARKIIEELEDNLEHVDREKVLEVQTQVALEEQKAKEQKMKEASKLLDYFTRAMRIEERPLLVQAFAQQKIDDRQYYEEQWQRRLAQHRKRHEFNVAEKKRIVRMKQYRDTFHDRIMEERKLDYEEQLAQQKERFRRLAERRALEQARREAEQRAREELQRKEEERLEIERIEHERTAAKRREVEKAKLAEREEEDERLRRQAEIQANRLEEIERRRMEERERGGVRRGAALTREKDQAEQERGESWRRTPTVVPAGNESRSGKSFPGPSTTAAAGASTGVSREADRQQLWRGRNQPERDVDAPRAWRPSGNNAGPRTNQRSWEQNRDQHSDVPRTTDSNRRWQPQQQQQGGGRSDTREWRRFDNGVKYANNGGGDVAASSAGVGRGSGKKGAHEQPKQGQPLE